jgi:hypothetical protein
MASEGFAGGDVSCVHVVAKFFFVGNEEQKENETTTQKIGFVTWTAFCI